MKNLLWLTPVFLLLIICTPDTTEAAIISCPDTAEALAPAPLEEEWAVEWWMPRHQEKLEEEGRENAKLLFLGDSITHGWETTGKKTYEEYYSEYGVYNIGFSGDRTENVLWRLEHDELDGINPELAVMMIGTNNTGHRQDSPECTTRGIEQILSELNERLPETRVLLLAVFPRETSPDHEMREINDEINRQIEKLADGEQVVYLDINHVFLNEEGQLPEEIMPDQLHPNEYGYELWAEAMEPVLKQLLEE